jgi:hypothetical protein
MASSNQGMQSFLEAANAQQQGLANSGAQNNTFLSTGQDDPTLESLGIPNMYGSGQGYGAPSQMGPQGYGYGGPIVQGQAYPGNVYGGGVTQQGGLLNGGYSTVGGLTQNASYNPGGGITGGGASQGGTYGGGLQSMGGYYAGYAGPQGAVNPGGIVSGPTMQQGGITQSPQLTPARVTNMGGATPGSNAPQPGQYNTPAPSKPYSLPSSGTYPYAPAPVGGGYLYGGAPTGPTVGLSPPNLGAPHTTVTSTPTRLQPVSEISPQGNGQILPTTVNKQNMPTPPPTKPVVVASKPPTVQPAPKPVAVAPKPVVAAPFKPPTVAPKPVVTPPKVTTPATVIPRPYVPPVIQPPFLQPTSGVNRPVAAPPKITSTPATVAPRPYVPPVLAPVVNPYTGTGTASQNEYPIQADSPPPYVPNTGMMNPATGLYDTNVTQGYTPGALPGTPGGPPVNNPFAAMSDEDEKTQINPDNVKAMLDHLHAYTYRYKDPDAPGAAPGRRMGVMAQDLERSPIGKQFVRDTPNGKMVDYGQAAGAMMAGLAYHNERLDAQDKMLKQLTGNGSGK